jgi:hypothetical protein
MIQDPEISQMEVGRLVEDWTKIDEDHYLDGPVTPRVAVIDLNPNTEALEPGAVFIPPEGRRKLGSYKVDRQRITRRISSRSASSRPCCDDVHVRGAGHAGAAGRMGLPCAAAARRAARRLVGERLLRAPLAQPQFFSFRPGTSSSTPACRATSWPTRPPTP